MLLFYEKVGAEIGFGSAPESSTKKQSEERVFDITAGYLNDKLLDPSGKQIGLG